MAKKGGKKKNKGGAKPAAAAAVDKVVDSVKDVVKPQDEVEEGSDANVADSAVASKTEVPANEEKLAETSADKTTAPVAPVTETKETETVADQAAPAVEKIEEPVRQEEKVEAPLVGESVAHEVEDKTQPPQPEASVSRDLENGDDDKVVLPTSTTATSPIASEPYPSTSEVAAEEPTISAVPDTGVVAPTSTLPERPKTTESVTAERSELTASAVEPIATTAPVIAPIDEPAVPVTETVASVSEASAPIAAEESKSVPESAAPVSQTIAPVSEPVAPVTESIPPASETSAPIPEPLAPVTETPAPVSEPVAPVSKAAEPVVQSTAAPTDDAIHAKRPYEKPIFSNDEVKPHKMAKTEDDQPVPATNAATPALTGADSKSTAAQAVSQPTSTSATKPTENKEVEGQTPATSAATPKAAAAAAGAPFPPQTTQSSPQAVAAAAAALNNSRTDKSATTGPINVAGTEPKKPEPAAVRGEEPKPPVDLPAQTVPAESTATETSVQPEAAKTQESEPEPSGDQQAEKKKGGFFAKLKRMFK
ncbi:hypothetical protein PDE_08109 [Penicillium oxalicum 114-2]|uniref:Uncharacterized protein n=1 Tax=Penicillium oxalicum (strain 114-2 / CGMCC 5302) TaxID=933388 RepID=S8BDP4_PENO1|nr:hypothetical protein PDE_08109 [Penicillium oxalicum 114-2]